MKRSLWGRLNEEQDAESRDKQIEIDKEIMTEKRGELKILHSSVFFEPKETHIKLLSKNQTVNQIVGLKRKQNKIDEIIDCQKTDQFRFQQMLPNLRETIEKLPSASHHIPTARHNDKFNKICFIPPTKTNFTIGKPKEIQKVNKTCAQLALKKSICGLARIVDYTESTQSALTMFTDAVDHFYKSLMESIVDRLTDEDRETETDVDLLTFERAYFAVTGDSTLSFFNYFKNEIHDKHQKTVSSFTEKVSELRSIIDSRQSALSDVHQPDYFYLKEEIKQEFDDF